MRAASKTTRPIIYHLRSTCWCLIGPCRASALTAAPPLVVVHPWAVRWILEAAATLHGIGDSLDLYQAPRVPVCLVAIDRGDVAIRARVQLGQPGSSVMLDVGAVPGQRERVALLHLEVVIIVAFAVTGNGQPKGLLEHGIVDFDRMMWL